MLVRISKLILSLKTRTVLSKFYSKVYIVYQFDIFVEADCISDNKHPEKYL